MKKIWTAITALVLVLSLAACGSISDIDVGLPDFTTTAQLIVVYAPDAQTVRLTNNTCEDIPTVQYTGAAEGVNLRAYYGLKPGNYCLEWGDTFSAGWLLRGWMDLELSAGVAEYVSVIPAAVAE